LGLKEGVQTHESTHSVAGPTANREQTDPIPVADLFFFSFSVCSDITKFCGVFFFLISISVSFGLGGKML